MKSLEIYINAIALRDRCMAEMSRCASDPNLVADQFDPGDAHIDIKGNPKNVLDVLYILDAIGVPGCRAR